MWIDVMAVLAVAALVGVGYVGGLLTAVGLDIRDQWRAQTPAGGRLVGLDGSPMAEG